MKVKNVKKKIIIIKKPENQKWGITNPLYIHNQFPRARSITSTSKRVKDKNVNRKIQKPKNQKLKDKKTCLANQLIIQGT